MKNILLALIFVPVFLFAQKESQEFVVKKPETVVKKSESLKVYYSMDIASNTAGLLYEYIWIKNNDICYYMASNNLETEYKADKTSWLSDSLRCFHYTTNKDTIKFMTTWPEMNGTGYERHFYTFYPSSSNWLLHFDLLHTDGTKTEETRNFVQFIPAQKK